MRNEPANTPGDVDRHWGRATGIFVHFLLYCVVIPFYGAFFFLLYRYIFGQGMSVGLAVLTAIFGATLGLPFVFLVGLSVAAVLLPSILFLRRNQVVFLHILVVMIAPWLIIKDDPYFLEHLVFVLVTSFFIAVASSLVYVRFGIFALLRRKGV